MRKLAINEFCRPLSRLFANRSGVAFLEFAYALPAFLLVFMGGAELANFVTTKMRVSQIALHLADHASRMGTGSLLSAKSVSETNINDVLTGAGLQAGELDLYANGRVVLTNLEPVANPNETDRYKVTWQRCRGSATYPSNTYGWPGRTDMAGIGPTNRQVKSPDNNATMFVEVHYKYKPLIAGQYAPWNEITEFASMTVRERRDLSKIYNSENATKSTC